MTPDAPREPERDAWLSEALRHAPDALLGPPAALSDAILREARSAAAPASGAASAPAGRRSARHDRARWTRFWSCLARPQIAAGFASVLAATLVGMMWWDRPLDDAMPHREGPAESQSRATPPQAVPRPTERADPEARSRSAPPESKDSPHPSERRDEAKAIPSDRADAAAPHPFPAAPPTADDNRRASAAAPDSAARDRGAAAAAIKKERDTAALQRQAPATVEGPGSMRERAPMAAAPSTLEPEAPARAADAGGVAAAAEARAGRSAKSATAAPVPSGGLGANSAATVSSAARLVGLPARIAAEPQRWTWQREAEPPRPMRPALQRWLARVEAALASAGSAADVARGDAAGESSPSARLRLLRDGRLHATLSIDGARITAQVAGDPAAGSQVALAPALGAALMAELDDATR